MKKQLYLFATFTLLLLLLLSCREKQADHQRIKPLFVTEKVKHDSDDPAIWINPADTSKSLIIGTDKNKDGALYVFDLEGKIIEDKVVYPLQRPNNVDVEYGFMLNGQEIDIAVTTERLTNKLLIFKLPEMQAIDNSGINVFAGESRRAPMGIALYKRASDQQIFAIVGRKEGPTDGTYLWQYLLKDNGDGAVVAEKVRAFGEWSGKKEIEALCVDDELGYVYYSDETVGVRKYHADPDHKDANRELALFATEGFAEDHEGISILDSGDGKGYILVSDQQADEFHIFTREGSEQNPHDHQRVKVVKLSTHESDGSEITACSFQQKFPGGLFVAMSDDKTFHYYAWEQLIGKAGN
ncbi:phytase [candidate division KSB1 bacterium]|nr:phytase [candidate division KSB1 bacterium]